MKFKFMILSFLIITSIIFAENIIFQMGPSGGRGGNEFKDSGFKDQTRIKTITVYAGNIIDSIEITYITENKVTKSDRHGGGGGDKNVFNLDDDEYIIKISGKYGNKVDSLIIQTNKRTLKKCGKDGGDVNFSYEAPEGMEIIGFFGHAGDTLDSIGVIIRIKK